MWATHGTSIPLTMMASTCTGLHSIRTPKMMLLCNEFGLVLCNIYRKVELLKIKLGRKKRKRFLEGYAKVASRFIAVNGGYAEKLKKAAEKLYRALESYDALDLIQNSDDCACAIFVLSGLRDLGKDATHVALAFNANAEKVGVLTAMALSSEYGMDKNGNTENKREEAKE